MVSLKEMQDVSLKKFAGSGLYVNTGWGIWKHKCKSDGWCSSDHKAWSLQYFNQNKLEMEMHNRVKNEQKSY